MDNACTKTATPLTKTKHLQEVWNFKIPEEPVINLQDLKGCHAQLKDELEELQELIQNIESNRYIYTQEDIDELSDVCIDIIEYCQQLIVRSGLSERYTKDSHAIYENNLTKTCETQKEAEETLSMYLRDGIVCYADKNKWGQWVIKDSETDHVKKPVGFVPVKL